MLKFLCHIWLGTHTQLMLVNDHQECRNSYPEARIIWAESYDMKNDFERRRLGGICGYSSTRCPGYVDKPENGPSPPGALDYYIPDRYYGGYHATSRLRSKGF